MAALAMARALHVPASMDPSSEPLLLYLALSIAYPIAMLVFARWHDRRTRNDDDDRDDGAPRTCTVRSNGPDGREVAHSTAVSKCTAQLWRA